MRRALALLVSILTCLAIAGTVAAAPMIERIPVNDSGIVDEFLTQECGTPIWIDVWGHITSHVWTDADGNPVRELNNYALHATWYSDFASLRTVDRGVDRVTHLADGSIILTVVGDVTPIHVPGQGLVYADIGQTTLHISFPDQGDPIVEVLSSHGQHGGSDFVEVICGLLAP